MSATTKTTPSRSDDGGQAHRLLLAWAPEGAQGRVAVLGEQPLRIGRVAQPGARCLVLDHPEVSRAHAVVEASASGGFALRDLGSHNGCHINGQAVAHHELCDGDVLRLGSHLLLYQVLSAAQCELLLGRTPAAGSLIGVGHAIVGVRRSVARAARSQMPVLVTGESGVGKELVAQAVHAQSGRAGRFVAINCAALPAALIESELFGHARGAFTGAVQARAGLFEEADGGTLFLDEIGDMPLALQAKLLRALATGEVRRVGESRNRRFDIKLVAATNATLDEAVEQGRFRGDLYARLIGVGIELPPLRARREDILPLVHHFLARAGSDAELDADVAEALLTYGWPFNVRELEQVVTVAAELGGDSIRLDDLPQRVRGQVQVRGSPAEPATQHALWNIARDAVPDRAQLEVVLRHYQGNVKRAAAFFGRDRRVLYRWCEDHEVSPDAFRPSSD